MPLKTIENNNTEYFYNWGRVPLVEISGPDAYDFLHRLSTASFKQYQGRTLHGAFLTGQARFLSMFTVVDDDAVERSRDSCTLFIEPDMISSTVEYLEKMHFTERLEISLKEKFVVEHRSSRNAEGTPAYFWGLKGTYVISDSQKEFSEGIFLNQKEFDSLRAYFGFPKPLVDLTPEHLLLEAPLEDIIDRNKGCYPGQEIIEKIYTYGRLPRKILKINFDKPVDIKTPYPLKVGSENVGFITSVHQVNDQQIGMATLNRVFYEKNQNFEALNFKIGWSSKRS